MLEDNLIHFFIFFQHDPKNGNTCHMYDLKYERRLIIISEIFNNLIKVIGCRRSFVEYKNIHDLSIYDDIITVKI